MTPRHLLLPQRGFRLLPQRALHTATNLTPTRRLLQLTGADAPKFLQGITTSNILQQQQHPSYTSFLNPQGRVLYEAFLYPLPTNNEPSFLLETDAAALPRLAAHLRRYKLRSKIQIAVTEDWEVWATWGSDSDIPATLTDPRAPHFGSRLLLPRGETPGGGGGGGGGGGAQLVGGEEYKRRRMLHGIAEGVFEIAEGSALPLESNLDLSTAIDFRKGCYVGQELTIRTKHTGVVRKRILPVAVYAPDTPIPTALEEGKGREGVLPPAGSPVKATGKRGRPVGKWLGGVGNVGLALCRLEAMTSLRLGGEESSGGAGFSEGDEFAVEWEEGGEERAVRVKAFVPKWMRERLEAR